MKKHTVIAIICLIAATAFGQFNRPCKNTGPNCSTPTPTPSVTPTPSPTPIPTMKPIPRGAYELMSGKLDQPLPDQSALNRPSIDGIRLKAAWKNIETSPGVYNWANIDGAIAQVIAKAKKCGLSVNAGIDCPAWLYSGRELATHAQAYVLIDTSRFAGETVPYPGDPVFISRWNSFVAALGARYDSHAELSYILMTGPGNHDEWNLATGAQDTINLFSTQAQVDVWIAECEGFIDTFLTAFPTTTVFAALHRPCSNSMGWPAMITACNYGVAKGPHFGLGFNGLNANSSTSYYPANQIYLHWDTNPTLAQFAASGGGTSGTPDSEGVDQGLRAAVALKIRGAEIYKPDCDDNSIYDYTAPTGSIWQGNDVSGTEAGITPRRTDLLTIP
jgi:hypothetical protein